MSFFQSLSLSAPNVASNAFLRIASRFSLSAALNASQSASSSSPVSSSDSFSSPLYVAPVVAAGTVRARDRIGEIVGGFCLAFNAGPTDLYVVEEIAGDAVHSVHSLAPASGGSGGSGKGGGKGKPKK